MFSTFQIPLSWGELLKRTAKEFSDDNCTGLAAQLAYYLLLALVPAIAFLLGLTSFLPGETIQNLVASAGAFLPDDIIEILRAQLKNIAEGQNGGVAIVGLLLALWSSSAAVVAVTDALNRAYDIEEGRPWWKVRLTAILLTLALAAFVIVAFGLVLVGPTLAEWLASHLGLGPVFEWTWKILQWPLVIALVALALAILNYFAPDAEQDWTWITPGALLATVLWLVASLAFKVYVTNFANYNETYGSLGGVVVLMLWFYISGMAILVGAEMNAEIEHASPHGKDPGEKVPGQKKAIGAAAARAYKNPAPAQPREAAPAPVRPPVAAFQGSRSGGDRKLGLIVGLPFVAARLWNRLKRGREQGA